PLRSTLFPYTTLFRSLHVWAPRCSRLPRSTNASWTRGGLLAAQHRFRVVHGHTAFGASLGVSSRAAQDTVSVALLLARRLGGRRSEEHTSELQSRSDL